MHNRLELLSQMVAVIMKSYKESRRQQVLNAVSQLL